MAVATGCVLIHLQHSPACVQFVPDGQHVASNDTGVEGNWRWQMTLPS
jgi:hypothetical protein